MARLLERTQWCEWSQIVTNFKFEMKEFTSFSLFILKFKINSDGFPQSCHRSYAVPGLYVVRLLGVGL